MPEGMPEVFVTHRQVLVFVSAAAGAAFLVLMLRPGEVRLPQPHVDGSSTVQAQDQDTVPVAIERIEAVEWPDSSVTSATADSSAPSGASQTAEDHAREVRLRIQASREHPDRQKVNYPRPESEIDKQHFVTQVLDRQVRFMESIAQERAKAFAKSANRDGADRDTVNAVVARVSEAEFAYRLEVTEAVKDLLWRGELGVAPVVADRVGVIESGLFQGPINRGDGTPAVTMMVEFAIDITKHPRLAAARANCLTVRESCSGMLAKSQAK